MVHQKSVKKLLNAEDAAAIWLSRIAPPLACTSPVGERDGDQKKDVAPIGRGPFLDGAREVEETPPEPAARQDRRGRENANEVHVGHGQPPTNNNSGYSCQNNTKETTTTAIIPTLLKPLKKFFHLTSQVFEHRYHSPNNVPGLVEQKSVRTLMTPWSCAYGRHAPPDCSDSWACRGLRDR